MRLKGLFTTIVLGVLAVAAGPVLGQAQGGGGGGGGGAGGQGGGRGGRGNFQQRQQQFEDRLKELMAANDDEWKVIWPKVQKVQELQRGANSGGRGMMGMLFGGGGGGRRNRGGNGGGGGGGGGGFAGGGGGNTNPSPVQEKAQDLQTLLSDKEAKPEDIKAKLAALREARTQAKADLTKAQEDLREILTARQEALLVMFGMLD